MLRRFFLAALAGLALLAIAALEISLLVPLEAQVCSQNEQTHQEDCSVHNAAFVVLRQTVEILNYSSPALTALATIAIAAFTLILWLATSRQAKLTREAIELGNREFIATHRPKLILREAVSLITDPLEAKIMVTYTLANVGASDCWITEAHIGIDFMSGQGYPVFMMTPDQAYPNNVPYIGRFGAGERRQLRFVDPHQVWDYQRRHDWDDTELGLHFVGHVAYIDAPGSNVARHIAFRWKYNPNDQRFHRIWPTENEHEYAD
jgi:hypothetical protein